MPTGIRIKPKHHNAGQDHVGEDADVGGGGLPQHQKGDVSPTHNHHGYQVADQAGRMLSRERLDIFLAVEAHKTG